MAEDKSAPAVAARLVVKKEEAKQKVVKLEAASEKVVKQPEPVVVKAPEVQPVKEEEKIKLIAEVKSEPKPEAKVEAKPEVKPEAKVEIKPEPKIEAKVETKPEVKSEEKPVVAEKQEAKPVVVAKPATVVIAPVVKRSDLIECNLNVARKVFDEAHRNKMSLSDLIRKVIDLPVSLQETVHITLALSDEEYATLAKRFEIDPEDKAAIRAKIVEELASFTGEKAA